MRSGIHELFNSKTISSIMEGIRHYTWR